MKTDWKKRFDKKFGLGTKYFFQGYEQEDMDDERQDIKQFISKELDKAREEGWQSGYRQCREKDLK